MDINVAAGQGRQAKDGQSAATRFFYSTKRAVEVTGIPKRTLFRIAIEAGVQSENWSKTRKRHLWTADQIEAIKAQAIARKRVNS